MAGGGDELKLLGMWASPFVLRVKLALSFKGLKYEYVEEDIFGNKSDLLLGSNPVHKKVPVLIHNGKPVCESQVIVQYLDEVYSSTGPSVLPVDPYERAMARFWASFIDEKVSTVPYPQIIQYLQEISVVIDVRAEGMKQSLVAAENVEAAFKEISAGKPFFGGDSVGYLDVTLGALVAWVHAAEKLDGTSLFDGARTPLLNAWVERFGALEAAKAVLPDVNRLVEFAKRWQPQAAAAAASNN